MCVHPLQPCVWLCSSVLHCTVLYGVRLPEWLSREESTCQCRREFRFLVWEDPLEKETATHSSILAWKSPGQRNLVAESSGLQRYNLMTEQQHCTEYSSSVSLFQALAGCLEVVCTWHCWEVPAGILHCCTFQGTVQSTMFFGFYVLFVWKVL